jgi:hypothetical protein
MDLEALFRLSVSEADKSKLDELLLTVKYAFQRFAIPHKIQCSKPVFFKPEQDQSTRTFLSYAENHQK